MKKSVKEYWSFEGESALVRYSDGQANESAVIFLHGFPADSGKNEDVAKHLTETFKVDCFVFHYKGLGKSNGLFSFTSSIADSLKITKKIKLEIGYRRLFVIGHSWGGLVALNIMREFQRNIDKCILLAPFCLLPDEINASQMIQDFIDAKREHNINYDFITMYTDFLKIREKSSPFEFASTIDEKKLSIIQGTDDIVSLPEGYLRLIKSFNKLPLSIQVQDDHWFKNRTRLIDFIAGELKKSDLQ
jgi:pimeloyl-ACP methyl ester carboxylesterase